MDAQVDDPGTTTAIDGVQLAIFKNRFENITRKMANTLLRTSRSGVINTARDFSCCILTRDDELVSAAECYPIHVLRGADLMAMAMKRFHPELRRGDAYLHNSPYHGNTHAADHTILVPVMDKRGRHQFTVFAKAHLADCGNSLPTTYMAAARDVYEEGALIFPAVKIQQDYKDRADIVRMCQMRLRAPELWWGDYLATLGAARIGESEMTRLGEDVGWETLHGYAKAWFDYSERAMIDAIRKTRAGRATAVTTHDVVPGAPPGGIKIQATVRVKRRDAMIEIDLRDNPDSLPCGLNLSEATATTASLVGVFNSIHRHIPANAGSFRRITVKLRQGCVVGIPIHPTSCSVATTNLADRVTNSVQRALAQIDDRLGMADGGAAFPPACGVISGSNPHADGAPFVNQIILGAGGGPGTPVSDGWLTLATMGNAGMPWYDSVEVDEVLHPILVYERRLRTDGEGAGKFRGAPGARIEFGPRDCELEVGYVSDGTTHPAEGVRGGGAGRRARQFRRLPSRRLVALPAYAQMTVRADETVLSLTTGGGGYGSPLERDPARVQHDLDEGWISRRRAEQVYGVVVGRDKRIDLEATKRRRLAMTRKTLRSSRRGNKKDRASAP